MPIFDKKNWITLLIYNIIPLIDHKLYKYIYIYIYYYLLHTKKKSQIVK